MVKHQEAKRKTKIQADTQVFTTDDMSNATVLFYLKRAKGIKPVEIILCLII